MVSVKETDLYSEVLKEINYSFGTVYIFNGYVISEINKGLSFNWKDHGKVIVDDVVCFLGTDGSELIYISNRINSYSVVASDWLKYFKNSYSLKEYYIVSETKTSKLGLMVENLFFNNKIKKFNSLHAAINWIKKGIDEMS